jgi:predicted histidine transporter YuiF (NhaC family)
MIFKSHFITMLIYAFIVSVILAIIRFEKKEEIIKAGLRMFAMMMGGVILFSWIMYLI